MKKVSVLFAALFVWAASFAQTWTVDKAHAKVGFTITHMLISDVDGSFKKFDASFTSSKPDFSDAVFTMTADVSTINTDNDQRDGHLKSPDFFDVAKYPTLNFESKSLKKTGERQYTLTGNLTMHGVTKPITLTLSYRGPSVNPMSKKNVAGFRVSGKINRSDFNLASKMPSAMLSEEVELNVNGEFQQG